jgi:murein DD-endopeptidase MepM/ murein hydrolase activator NlpD
MPLVVLLLGWFAPSCWQPPVTAPVWRGFEAPACTWCAGHRGLEYQLSDGVEVHAVAPGTVVFAGTVAGQLHVTVQVAGGRKVTYAFVRRPLVRTGAHVAAGQVLALGGRRLLLTVRDGDTYLDPAPLLGRWVGRPRLVPTDGGQPRVAPALRLACASSGSAR